MIAAGSISTLKTMTIPTVWAVFIYSHHILHVYTNKLVCLIVRKSDIIPYPLQTVHNNVF